MSKNNFVKVLQHQARRQSQLQDSSPIPRFLNPVTATVGEHPWQSLLATSFIVAWITFILWFEFFYHFVQNIVEATFIK